MKPSKTLLKIIEVLELTPGNIDFQKMLLLWAETEPDLVAPIKRITTDADSGNNSASAMMLMMALSFEAGRATEVGIMCLRKDSKWPKHVKDQDKKS